MVIGKSPDSLCTIVDPDVTTRQLQTNNKRGRDKINLVSTNSGRGAPKWTSRYNTVESDYRNSTKIPIEYKKYRESFFTIFEPLQALRDRHLKNYQHRFSSNWEDIALDPTHMFSSLLYGAESARGGKRRNRMDVRSRSDCACTKRVRIIRLIFTRERQDMTFLHRLSEAEFHYNNIFLHFSNGWVHRLILWRSKLFENACWQWLLANQSW